MTKQVTAYQTFDGKLFLDIISANKHEIEILSYKKGQVHEYNDRLKQLKTKLITAIKNNNESMTRFYQSEISKHKRDLKWVVVEYHNYLKQRRKTTWMWCRSAR